MIYVQVKADRDPRVLADLIASTHGDREIDPKLAVDVRLVQAVRQHLEAERPAREDLDTVNFQRLDDDNDWTDL
jgi:hypothetical protein